MAEFLKCVCEHCSTKYRLPVEFQGRTARCKKCGEKFSVPKLNRSLEDSVLDWLADESEADAPPTEKPREITMPKGDPNAARPDSVVRMKASESG